MKDKLQVTTEVSVRRALEAMLVLDILLNELRSEGVNDVEVVLYNHAISGKDIEDKRKRKSRRKKTRPKTKPRVTGNRRRSSGK